MLYCAKDKDKKHYGYKVIQSYANTLTSVN